MGPTIPTEPSGADFPSITRADQARETQSEVHQIARDAGWQPPRVDALPKADSESGLKEGTPLASRDTLTSGQKARVDNLPKPSLGMSTRELHNNLSREDPNETRVTSYAARAARGATAAAQRREVGATYDSNGVRIYPYPSNPQTAPNYSSLPVIKEYQQQDRRHLSTEQNRLRSENEWSADRKAEKYKAELAEKIEQHRYAARRLYERDPARYAGMPPQDFIGLLAEYMRDEDELSTIEEVEIGDESAQVSQIERIIDELGSDAGVKEVLGRLSERVDIPDMPQQLTFENFIASVIDNKKQAIGAAKVRAQRQREFMAEKYSEDPHIERGTN